ncbi:MAG: hypothetical protein ACD_2C00016G0017 [uncultured bacterium (gcode 4)]|uniref:Uncharacterized protein n=1 Tax=uncultured bacterium (gcode 4) TaxID=1234023 RepID=K2FGJ4_9BACT|nr:MAG: hypothetical protein ACD_2C00016G0017 [uncultured bacterium (gcode 4)]
MISYNINRFIHTVIRDNKLFYLMELLLSENKKEDILFEDLIKQLKHFLKKDNEEIFDHTKLKYLAFLWDFKHNVDNLKNLKDKNNIEVNTILFKLYDIPKKRNNLLLVFLLYFYINNKDKLWWDEIFKMIYIYFMIIIYRNRVSKWTREKLSEIDKIKFKPLNVAIKEKYKILTRKHSFLKSKTLWFGVSIFCMLLISLFWYLNFNGSFLRTDILSSTNNTTFWKVAFDSIMIWRVSDSMITSVQWIWLTNILLVVAVALLVQSLKTSLSTIFFNWLLTKVFHFLWTVIKYAYRTVFYIYDYITYKLATKYIFSFINSIVNKKLLPGPMIIWFFWTIYSMIYFFVVFLYIFFFVWLFNIPLHPLYIATWGIIISFLVMYINFHEDLNNFKTFLIETEWIVKEIYDKVENEKKEKLKISELKETVA